MKKEIKEETRGRNELPDSEKLTTIRVGIKRSIIDEIGSKALKTELKRHSETLVKSKKLKNNRK